MDKKIYEEDNFGNKIRALRLRKKKTIADLQIYFYDNKYPITKKSIYLWERNITIPNLDAIKLIGQFYNISIERLFNITKRKSRAIVSKEEAEFIFAIRNFPNYKRAIYNIMCKEEKDEYRI